MTDELPDWWPKPARPAELPLPGLGLSFDDIVPPVVEDDEE